jgi:chromosome partitioning protein
MIISSVSYKGGVGKSTIAQNLAVAFAKDGYKVILIDADESAATSKWAGTRAENEIDPFIQVVPKLDPRDLIPSVKRLYEDNDIIIIDGPPSLFPIVSKILLVSHIILVPVTPKGGSDIWVTQDFLSRYEEVKQSSEQVGEAFFVLNMFKDNFNLHRAFAEALEENQKEFGVRKLEAILKERVAFGEANSQGLSVVEYTDPKAKAELKTLYEEIVGIYQTV